MIRVRGYGRRRQDETLGLVGARRKRGAFEWTARLPNFRNRSPQAADLLRVGRALHLADRLVRRGASLGRQLRRVEVEVTVAEPDRWRPLTGLIEQLVEFATGGDSWSLSFAGGADDDVWSRRPSADPRAEPTVVALFSGGLDSLCGAAYLAAQRQARPVFVTHSPPGRESMGQLLRDLYLAFGLELPRSACASYRLELREATRAGVRSMFQEPTRRTRPLYFLSLAGATAIACEVPVVQMSENGALALSLPYRADVHGPAMARQAHTYLLAGFAVLLGELVPGVSWTVANPFLDATKGEACGWLGPAAELARRSASCEYLGRQRAVMLSWKRRHPNPAQALGHGPQCGLCVPCLVRRAALKRASVADPDADYLASAPSVLATTRAQGSAVHLFGREDPPPLLNMLAPNVLYMERHCKRLLTAAFEEYVIQYLPELRSNRRLGDMYTDLRACNQLSRRYAREILAFLHG